MPAAETPKVDRSDAALEEILQLREEVSELRDVVTRMCAVMCCVAMPDYRPADVGAINRSNQEFFRYTFAWARKFIEEHNHQLVKEMRRD